MSKPRKKNKMAVHFSSKYQGWSTPADFFAEQAAKYGPFDLDVCALPHSAKCARYFTMFEDGLWQRWSGVCWCNPPYNNVRAWITKAYNEVAVGNATKVVCLIPARPGSRVWHNIIFPHAVIRWLPGRIKFVGAESSAPFDSALVVFGDKQVDGEAYWRDAHAALQAEYDAYAKRMGEQYAITKVQAYKLAARLMEDNTSFDSGYEFPAGFELTNGDISITDEEAIQRWLSWGAQQVFPKLQEAI